MVTKEKLKDYAGKLMFDMDDAGYDRTLEEFETVEKHMAFIGEIEGIDSVEPMTFPFKLKDVKLREDVATSTLTTEDAVKNAKETIYDEIKVPKVVGGES